MLRSSGLSTRRLTREEASVATEALDSWLAPTTYGGNLQSGDIGWLLRLDDESIDGTLHIVADGGESVAVLMADGPVARPALRPDRLHDLSLALILLELTETLMPNGEAFTEAPSGSTYRTVLSSAGWVIDPDPWVILYRPLTGADGEYVDEQATTLTSDEDIADRVAVQRSAFEKSTFTVARWHQMAAGPTYDPGLEWLRRTRDGEPAAGATGWSAGPGKCGMLEPVGTHPDHRREGHGVAVSRAAIAALARAGASGVTVHTPADNAAAVAAYRACGLRPVEYTYSMVRPPTGTAE
jgi:GNAT superfamily N-acetyltransferase